MIGRKIPEKWQAVAEDMDMLLSIADQIARHRYPGGCAPAGIVPALLVALTYHVNANKQRRRT